MLQFSVTMSFMSPLAGSSVLGIIPLTAVAVPALVMREAFRWATRRQAGWRLCSAHQHPAKTCMTDELEEQVQDEKSSRRTSDKASVRAASDSGQLPMHACATALPLRTMELLAEGSWAISS